MSGCVVARGGDSSVESDSVGFFSSSDIIVQCRSIDGVRVGIQSAQSVDQARVSERDPARRTMFWSYQLTNLLESRTNHLYRYNQIYSSESTCPDHNYTQ